MKQPTLGKNTWLGFRVSTFNPSNNILTRNICNDSQGMSSAVQFTKNAFKSRVWIYCLKEYMFVES